MTLAPSDYGLKAWSYDPIDAAAGSALAAGVISLVAVKLRFGASASGLRVVVTTAGATVANAFAGLYSEAGIRLGLTADQATPWQSTGVKTMALTSPVSLGPGWYYAALLFGSAGTPPQFARGAQGAVAAHNAGLVLPRARLATSGSAQTALPASINTGTIDPAGAAAHSFWVGLT